MNKTFGMIKPDAVASKHTGLILDLIERNKIAINKMKKIHLKDAQARAFYAIHNQRPWFNELIEFITSGPVIVMELECNDAVATWRNLMGATNPDQATVGTVRKMFAQDIGKNAVHGSDSEENAKIELDFFFADKCCK